jgi:hypothetical protein
MARALISRALQLRHLLQPHVAHFGSGGKKGQGLSPLLTELLLARRRDTHGRESRSAEWREALNGVRAACGAVSEIYDGQWQAAAAALQRRARERPDGAGVRLFSGAVASDAAELRALLGLMAGAGGKSTTTIRPESVLVACIAAAGEGALVADDGGARRCAEVLAALRLRGLSPRDALEVLARHPAAAGFDPAVVRDNLLFLEGATAASAAARDGREGEEAPLLRAIALGAPAALGRPTDRLRATFEFLVSGGYDIATDLRRRPDALERDVAALERQWAGGGGIGSSG